MRLGGHDGHESVDTRGASTVSTARTVANRLLDETRVMSPKKSPRLSRWTCPPTSTSATPRRMMYIASPSSPSWTMASRGRKVACPPVRRILHPFVTAEKMSSDGDSAGERMGRRTA